MSIKVNIERFNKISIKDSCNGYSCTIECKNIPIYIELLNCIKENPSSFEENYYSEVSTHYTALPDEFKRKLKNSIYFGNYISLRNIDKILEVVSNINYDDLNIKTLLTTSFGYKKFYKKRIINKLKQSSLDDLLCLIACSKTKKGRSRDD